MKYWNYKKLITNIILFYPTLYMAIYMISDGLGRRFAQFTLLVLLYGVIRKKQIKKKTIALLLGIGIIIIYNVFLNGIAYIMSLDFYGWILLLLVFHFFSYNVNVELIRTAILNERKVIVNLRLFFMLLIISIVFMEGLRVTNSWGISVPILYGPYEIPHGLSYSMVVMYALSSVMARYTNKKKYYIYMGLCFLGCVWTGARSGIMAMAILMIADYLSVRKVSIKIILLIFAAIILLFLGLFTNVLVNNPLFQKNQNAFLRNNLTNGRDWFNSYLFQYYFINFNTIQRIFGVGVENLRNIMNLRFGSFIHAHNDLLNTLVGFGFFGLIMFAMEFWGFVKNAPKYFWVIAILMALIFFNGLYMYVGFSASIPIIVAYFKCVYSYSEEKGAKGILSTAIIR